jgi:TOBE domain
LRPEHFGVVEAADGPASDSSWVVHDRRFSGSEILLEVVADDGERLWVEAGDRGRHLGLGDRVELTLRDVETVAFGRHAREGLAAGPPAVPGALPPAVDQRPASWHPKSAPAEEQAPIDSLEDVTLPGGG